MNKMCENCAYKIKKGEYLSSMSFGCGNDYCIHECRMFDCLAEENEKSHQIQQLDELERQLREELADLKKQ